MKKKIGGKRKNRKKRNITNFKDFTVFIKLTHYSSLNFSITNMPWSFFLYCLTWGHTNYIFIICAPSFLWLFGRIHSKDKTKNI